MPHKPRSENDCRPGRPNAAGTAQAGDPAAAKAFERALAQHRAGRLPDAIAGYRAILARWPGFADAHNFLGLALYQAGQPGPALSAIDEALARNAGNPDYRNNRGIVLIALGRAADAEAEFRLSLAARPNHAQTLSNLGNALKASGDLAGAMDQYRRAIASEPDHAEAWFNLGNAQRESGGRDDARESYRRVLTIDAGFAAAHANLGGLFFEDGDFAGARRAYEAALASGGERASFLYGLALACERLGDDETAATLYRKLLAQMPAHADALNNLAGLAERAGRTDEAEDLYRRALAANPQHDRAAYNLGALHAGRGETDAAARYLLMAKSARDDDVERLIRVGTMLHRIDRTDDAIDCYERVIALRPENAGAHAMLGALLLERRETERGIEHLDYAEAEGLDNGFLHHQLGLGQFRLCNLPAAIARFRTAIERDPATLAFRSSCLMALNYDDSIAAAALFEAHRTVMAPVNAEPASPPPPRARSSGEKIRIGYVSADLRAHSCANFLLPLLSAHDRDRFEIVCYANIRRHDAVTERFRALADRWRDILALDDPAAASLVRADGIDVLIDAGGHTGDNRLGLFRLAPTAVQATWLGYPNTTALAAIGARLVDAVSDPEPAADALATERLVRLAGGFLAYRPRLATPDPAPGPSQRGAPPRFGCFNNANKISDATIRLWAQLLAACPDARLALRSEQYRHDAVRARFAARFAAAGIDPARLEFPDWQNELDDALAGHADIDVALDPTPYNGTTTTCEALWMGVPVVTLAGDRHAARVGASILTQAGLADLVAATPADYVRIAAALLRDRNRLAGLRSALRATIAGSPVADGARLAAGFEAFFAGALSKASRGAG